MQIIDKFYLFYSLSTVFIIFGWISKYSVTEQISCEYFYILCEDFENYSPKNWEISQVLIGNTGRINQHGGKTYAKMCREFHTAVCAHHEFVLYRSW